MRGGIIPKACGKHTNERPQSADSVTTKDSVC